MSRHLIMNFYLFKKISSPCFFTISGVANTSPKQYTISWIWNDLICWRILSFPVVFDSWGDVATFPGMGEQDMVLGDVCSWNRWLNNPCVLSSCWHFWFKRTRCSSLWSTNDTSVTQKCLCQIQHLFDGVLISRALFLP